ncbi:PASTA domain-containing protein [Rathayibacter sp. VKM Ac-2803]|uniref:PASTA domain-containing protein n=1 Tax=Rathayibacter sp. VKM Ac-2803 TaxID=2609256 RepID=UPI0013589B3D|nr:PASTA domain-containing protein [Rathayibacter sp. VKM Ac-2803]MWV50427.1 PASTA domain-containing protein [Rathayibacter sp. VKM Ac-2803]
MKRFLPVLALVFALTSCSPSVASGGLASTNPPAEDAMVVVPDVAGMAGTDARDEIEDAGFQVQFDAGVDAGVPEEDWVVATQKPSAGERAAEGSAVTVTVSKEEETVAPVLPTDTAASAPADVPPPAPADAAPSEAGDTVPSAERDTRTTPSGLTVGNAILICDQEGLTQAPRGWNADFLEDGSAAVEGDSIALEAGVTITDENGVEGRFTVLCKVSGTNESTMIDSFEVY